MSSLSHHGIKGQRWGVRRFQNKDGTRTALGKHRDFERTASKVVEDLSNSPHPFVKRPLNKDEIRQRGLITQAEADQCAGLATSVFKQASQAEPQITGDVISVVSSTSAKMYGLNNRLKQPTSIAAKIGADAKADGITFEQAAGGLKDAIRYTAVSDSRDYVDTYNAIKQRLEEKGYTEVKCKNYFQKYQNGEVMHKAVQSTFSSPDGVEFEFQFQTPESQAAKELKVPIYNERRKAGNTPERNAELEQEMRNLAEQVPDPEGVFEIESHSGVTNSNKLKHTSIGGTMYIEGNALILGDSSYLEHHGILGQKWGVRRYQNKDGTRTSAGKKQDKQNRLKATSKDYASIRESLSDDDLKMLNYSNDEIKYMREHNTLGHDHIQYGRTAHRVIQKDKNGTPVTYVDATWFKAESLLTGKKAASIISIDLATRAGDEYRGKGHAIAAGKKMVKWFDTYGYKDYEYMEWAAKEENVSSQKTAEKLGFKKLDVHDEGWTLYAYEHKAKHTSIGGTMYIEGNALILGDSSYLEHHGILGQKWGVRRFQNKDGTRTAAGKAREDRRVLKKGTTVKRTSYGMYDETYDNKKYVSTNDDDAEKWSRYIGEAKARQGAVVFENEYQLKRDVAVATGKDICKIIDSEFKNADVTKLKEDTDYAARALRQDLNNMSREERVSLNFAMQTQSGKKIVKLLKKHGYDALEDDHGKNVSKDPVIILDPKKNMKRTRVTANANYYFDYINHTSIDDSPHLSHHGIKGQRWGVRRFQNKDGTRTAAGKKRDSENLKSSQEAKNVNSKIHSYINKQLSSEDLDTGKSNYDFASNLIKDPDFEKVIMPVVQDIRQTKAKYGNKEPYEFTGDEHQAYMNDIDRLDKKTGELAIAIGLAEKGEPNKKSTPPEGEYERVDMFRYALARYLDEHSPDGYSDEGDWIYHSSMEGTFFIEDGTLYLSHHGIRGQRWGVRRFQNRDGSLTNAGRKRLGYATKGATQAVKKAFNAGVKTGAKAVKAAKAHHEKAEAKKIEKKKEKASKTRAGVYANKDLFTAKELKELNSKFEEQDKLTMARIKHGVEIAKSIGEVAKSAGEVGKAYEALTGHKLVPDIMTLQNGGSKDKDSKDTKDKDSKDTKDKDNGTSPEDNGSGDKPKDNDVKGSKWDDSDLRNQMEAAKKQTSKAMKNAKLQEYIDAYNRDQNSEKNKELTARGQKAIEILSKGGKFNSEASSSSPTPTPKPAPSSNNLMAQIRAAQTKLEKPNKNETPAEHKEAQKKLNALEKVANEYKAAANKPGADPAEVTEKLLKKNKDILDDIKHMDFSDDVYLEHYGVRGMKWGKHLMAGKGGDLYEGTALGAGGGGGPMTEEERKKAEALRKKKLEEAKKKAEEAAKEKEIEEKAKEIGISAKAYKRYSIDNNHLPGKHHYNKSQKLHGEASSSLAETQAAERQAHMNRAKAASLMRKVNSSHMFDADGYHISQQRGDDRKEAKQLQKEAKQLDKASKKALKKFYKKRYKSDKERQKWQNSTSGKYHHMMRHYEIQNGVLFINAGEPYLEHHGVKGMKWGKHLMAGKGEAGAGGGSGEDDEKLKEMAKKAGMTVAEYRTKMASKIGGAASKVGEKVYDAAGGSHKKNAEGWRKMAQEESNAARASEKSSHENSARAASQDRKYGSGGDVYRRAADSDKENAKTHHSNAKVRSERAASEQAAYEKSLAGKYDKMKADVARKKSARKDKTFSGTSPKEKKRLKDVAGKKYDRSIAKRVDSIASKVSKARKRRVKHSDDTNAIYTEGTRLVVNSKWG